MKVARLGVSAIGAVLLAACGSSSNPTDSVVVDILSGQTYARCDGSGTKTSYAFDSGNLTRTTETFTANDCSGSALTSNADTLSYQNGAEVVDNDGNDVVQLDLTETGTTTYTIRRLSGGALGLSDLVFGSTADSDSGLDGSTASLRHNGLNEADVFELE